MAHLARGPSGSLLAPEVIVNADDAVRHHQYADSFYSCDDNDPRPTLDTDTRDQVAQALGQLSFMN